MTRNEFDAENLVEDFCAQLDTEATIEACNAIIDTAERIKDAAEDELESEED